MSTYDTLLTKSKGTLFTKEEMLSHHPKFLIINCLFGSISGLNALLLMYPFDVIRRHLHLNGSSPEHKYNSAFDVASQLFRKDGLKGLYKGL